MLLIPPGYAIAAEAAAAPGPALTRAPALQRFVEAAYPAQAAEAGLEGTVLLQVDLSETGSVTAVEVLEPAGHGFDEAAAAAVKQFGFSPAELDGKPAPVSITYEYRFVMKPAAPAAPEEPRQGPVNFSGRVLERGVRRPQPGATVSLPALGRTADADAEGRFEFRDVPAGSLKVAIAQPGFEPFATEETIVTGQQTRATYYLSRLRAGLFEAAVRGQRERKEVTRQTVSTEEVEKIPGTEGDTLRVVQNFPGVARPSFNGGDIVIRGTSANDSGVFLDGQRIPLLYHFGALTSVFNSALLDSVSYLPGNYSSYYGDLVGGVIDVKSRAPRKDRAGGYASVSLLESSLLLETPVGKNFSVAVAGRRSYIDAVLAAAPAFPGPKLSVAPRYYDAQAKAEWRVNDQHTLTLLALTSDDTLSLLFDRPSNGDPTAVGTFHLETGFTQVRLQHRYRGGGWRLENSALVGIAKVLVQPNAQRGIEINSKELGLRSTTEYEFGAALTVAGGIDVLHQPASIRANLPGQAIEGQPAQPGILRPVASVDSRFSQYYPSAWAEARWRPIPRLLLVPGVRSESYLFSEQTSRRRSLSPRLGMRLELSEELALKAGAGVYRGAPEQGEPTRAFGNPDIDAKQSNQYSVGGEWRPAFYAPLSVSLEGFYSDLSKLIVNNPDPAARFTGGPLLTNDGVGRTYGVEVLLRHQLTERFFGWLAYTYSHSERRDAPGAAWRLFDKDQPHVLTAIASYKLPWGIDVGARFRFASGNPYTPVVGARRNDTVDVFAPIYGAVNSQRQPSFNQADVRIDKTFTFETWILDLYLDVQNVYDNASVEGVTYNYNYSQRAYLTGLPILPILGAKGSF